MGNTLAGKNTRNLFLKYIGLYMYLKSKKKKMVLHVRGYLSTQICPS